MDNTLANFTDVLDDEIGDSQPLSLSSSIESNTARNILNKIDAHRTRPPRGTGQREHFRSVEEIDPKYRDVFSYPYFNLVQSRVIDDALYSDKSIVVCAPTGSGKTVVFEMAIVQLLMELEDKHYTEDFKIIYMAPVKALCTERLTEWYPKFNKLGLLCIEATGDTDVDFTQLKPYNIIITTPEKWDMLTRRWRDHRSLVEVVKLFLIDEVHILNDETRGPVLEAVVSRMKTIESAAQSVHRIELLQNKLHGTEMTHKTAPSIRFVAVSATVSNPEDVANWLGTSTKPAVFHKFGDETRPVKLKRIVEGYPCPDNSNGFKFDIFLSYKLWPIIQRYHSGKPTLIFCSTRKSVVLTAETLSKELTINFSAEQKAKLTALASTIKTKILQSLLLSGVGCHHAGLLYEERHTIEQAFRNRDLPILITTTTLAMGVNLPAHLVIIKNTQQYVNGGYQEYSISTVLQMVGRAGRPQFDTEATAVIMTRLADKARYQALVGGCEPLQSFLHKRLPENLNSEAALGTVGDVAQCVQWLRSTFLYVRAARDPKRYLNLPQNSPQHLILKKIEELCVRAMNSLASAGLITMDEASCIESTEPGRLMSIYYLDLGTMKNLMQIEGTESLDRLLTLICESHELSDMHLRVDERRCLNALNRNNAAATIRFPMKGKITTRQMKLNCIIQAVLGCLAIPDPSLNQEAMKIMRIVERICKCLVSYVTRSDLISHQPQFCSAVLNSIILAKCSVVRLWENSPFVSKQLKGIGPTFSTLLATAGKVNFLLLEESHPRDLERIMNKSAPAGNVLRKQVSLLPKYQLSMIPVDERTVTLQLLLLNQNYLSGNIEQLTAGSGHKSYIVVGDSNNHLLLIASFKDKDLISVFDGTITYEIKRKHNFEHKIFAHCISTTFAGIDVQTEYVFNDLNHFFGESSANSNLINEVPVKDTAKRQTCITDTFKQRKRKNTSVIDKTQSKEKKKRDNTIIENFKYLKKTFENVSKNIKQNVKLPNISYKTPNYEKNNNQEKHILNEETVNDEFTKINSEINAVEEIDSDDFIDNEKVDSILANIENEMSKQKENIKNTNSLVAGCSQQIDKIRDLTELPGNIFNNTSIQTSNRFNTFKKRKPLTKSNYSFIDLLERNLDLSDDEEKTVSSSKNNGFTDAIKSQIKKYIQKTETKANSLDSNVHLLIEKDYHVTPNADKDTDVIVVDSDTEELSPTQKLYPYEIKEILDSTYINKSNSITKGTQKETTNTKESTTSEKVYEKQFLNEKSLNKSIASANITDATYLYNDNLSNMNIFADKQFEHRKLSTPPEIIYEKISPNDTSLMTTDRNITHLSKNDSAIPLNDENITLHSKNNHNSEFCLTENNFKNVTKQSVKVHEQCFDKFHDDDRNETKTSHVTNTLNKDLIGSDIHLTKESDSERFESVNNDFGESVLSIEILDTIDIQNKKHIITDNTKLCLVPFQNCNTPIMDQFSRNTNTETTGTSHLETKVTEDNCMQCYYKSYFDNDAKEVSIIENVPEKDITCFRNRILPFNKHFMINTSIIPTEVDPIVPYNLTNDIQSCLRDKTLKPYSHSSKNLQDEFSSTSWSGCTRNFSYSTTKINVCSKQTPEYLMNIRVINQMKVDLNITKLASGNFPPRENMPEFICKNNVLNIHEVECNEPTKPSFINEQRIISKLKESHPIICEKQTESYTSQRETTDSTSKPSTAQNIIETKNAKIKTVENNDPVNGNTKVHHILQKYSKILGKDNTKSQTSSESTTRKNSNCNKTILLKPKKPFKISEIENLHATLPNTIIDCYKHTVEHTAPPYEFQDRKSMNEDVQSEPYVPFYNVDSVAQDDPYDSITDIVLEPINIPTQTDVEPITEDKIDESMFNPMVLLQSTSVLDARDEEIIPPPSQFCDLSDYNDDNIKDLNTCDNYSQYGLSQLDVSTDQYPNCNTDLFEDHCVTHLTPSREIETWTLDKEDCWEDKYSPAKSFTIVRRNTPNFCDMSEISGFSRTSRQAKLGQFKFNRKNKLRIRK